jgi:hypothetical protein
MSTSLGLNFRHRCQDIDRRMIPRKAPYSGPTEAPISRRLSTIIVVKLTSSIGEVADEETRRIQEDYDVVCAVEGRHRPLQTHADAITLL